MTTLKTLWTTGHTQDPGDTLVQLQIAVPAPSDLPVDAGGMFGPTHVDLEIVLHDRGRDRHEFMPEVW